MGTPFVVLMRRIRVLATDIAREAQALETAFRQSRENARAAVRVLRIKVRSLGGLIGLAKRRHTLDK